MFDISQFDKYREDNRREVKKAKGGLPISLWETYSAFANCYGGVIILGVRENHDGSWRTTGLENEAKLRKDFWDTVNNVTKVSINLLTDDNVKSYKVGNDIIMVIIVPAASREQKPVYINNDIFKGTFRRNWEGDYHCTPSEIRAMLRDQTNQTMDMKILEDWKVEDLNQETIQAYRNMHRSWKPGHVWGMLEDKEYLRNIGAVAVSKKDGRLHPTAAGLLMFGDEYNIVREFPEYFLDYREVLDPTIRWTDRLQSSSGEWSGNIFDFYFRVYNKLVKDIKIPFKLVRGVVIKKENDKLVFENPGYIRTGKVQMKRGGESDPRNKGLMKMFNLINIGERAGSGVPDVFKTWEEQGWEEPIIEERYGDAARTSLILPLFEKQVKKTSEKTSEIKQTEKTIKNKNRILECIRENGISKTSEIAVELELSQSRTRALLKEMVAEGKVVTRGGTKKKEYFLPK